MFEASHSISLGLAELGLDQEDRLDLIMMSNQVPALEVKKVQASLSEMESNSAMCD